MAINDGGPAFPGGLSADDGSAIEGGMSLRDWFAGQALVYERQDGGSIGGSMLDGLQKLSEMARYRGGQCGVPTEQTAIDVPYRPPTLTEQLQSVVDYHDKQAAQAREALEKLQQVPAIEEFLNAVNKLR